MGGKGMGGKGMGVKEMGGKGSQREAKGGKHVIQASSRAQE